MLRVLPRSDAREACGIFVDMLKTAAGGTPAGEGFFQKDFSGVWREIVSGGWHAVGISEEHGGIGFDLLDLTLFAEAWGAALVPLPFMPTMLLLRWAGVSADAAPADMLTYALPRNAGGIGVSPYHDIPGVRCVTDVSADGLATGAPSRRTASETTASESAASESATPSMPVSFVELATAGLSDVAVGELLVLGAAELIGGGAAVLARSVAHARDRVQFGRPIAEYQAVQHRLADMLRDVEVARTAVVKASNDPTHAAEAVAFAWDRVRRITENAVRVHGGFGFTWDAGLHHYTRHLMAWNDLLGACGVDVWQA